jgi:hypothetical protein
VNAPKPQYLRWRKVAALGIRAGDSVLGEDLDRLDSMLLGIAHRLLVSRPPISDHPVAVGEPLDGTTPPGGSQNPAPTTF